MKIVYRHVCLFIGLFCYSFIANSQDILYNESFTNQTGKGATGATPTVDLSDVTWTIDFSDADLSNAYRFRVRDIGGNPLFEGRNVGNSTWLSPAIPISNFSNISFSIDASQGNNTLDNSDSMTTQYRLDGGNWLTADTNGFLQNDYGSVIISQTGLSGSTLEIRVRMVNNANNERHRIDNILVTGTAPCSEAEDISNLTGTGANTSAILAWTNSACFDEVLIIGKNGSSPIAQPNGDGSNYLSNSYFGAGLEIANDEFVVYNDTGDTTIVTNLTNGNTYFFTVYTRLGLDWSSGVTVSVVPEITYCDSNSSSVEFEHITRVRLNTIDNDPGDNGATFYSDFTTLSTDLTKGNDYTITITAFKSLINDPLVFSVWIDYNANGDFNDTGELVFQQTAITTEVNGTFTVPITSSVGTTRMRVSMKFDTPSTPCETSFFYGEVEDYSINLTGSVPYIYDLGWQPANPNGVATSVDTISIINGEALFTDNTKANSITINPTGAMRVDPNVVIDISDQMTLESVSNAFSSLISDGIILGSLNYKRHVNEFNTTPGSTTGSNDLVAPPLTNIALTFNTFRNLPGNSVIPSGTIGGVPSFLFGPFNRDTNTYINYNASNDNDILLAGIGYRTASTVSGGSPLTFTGEIRNDIVSIPISIGSGSQWNLIGNPYPSYINSGDFLSANASVLDADAVGIYGYDGTAQNGWTILNFNTMNTTDNLAPGQGFMIAAEGTNSVSFTPAMRRNTGGDDFIEGRSASPNHMFILELTAEQTYNTSFYFNANSTRGLDPGYDAAAFGENAGATPIYSHLVQDNTGRAMAMQSLGETDFNDISIPLGVNVNQGTQLRFSIGETTLPSAIQVYLEDQIANTATLLNTSDYVFTPNNNLSGTGRFFLRFTDSALGTANNPLDVINIFTDDNTRTLVITGQLETITTISLYDLQGRLTLQNPLNTNDTTHSIAVGHLSTGVYVVELQSQNGSRTQKINLK
ncbi:GEVED domain-containing protein [Winogradskyella aurantia]|uniref:Uncharacterized protein n=1 Tax=Winogradskyella aurantia TaxID=1915063 RepID=A0A265UVL6_9FLAO|nr:GEVED domain-containing protein [Winogradskyella aurantia]OZV69252.1 hypothetical protein CA834_07285 [Winogradskyella aurantia]